MKKITIDKYCKNPPGTFKKFIDKENKKLQDIENERKERIKNRKNGISKN